MSNDKPVSVMGISGTVTEKDLARMHLVEWNWSRRQRWCLGESLDPRRKLANQVHFFVIPFIEVMGLSMLKISQHDPRDYVGKWSRYYGAWDVVDQMVAAGVNAWQPMLI